MNFSDACRFIEKHFKKSVFTDATGDAISPDDFSAVLDAVLPFIPFPFRKKNEMLASFLWSGCRKFNRWFAPSPYIVPDEFTSLHARFSGTLFKIESSPCNAPVFLVHSVRDRLYRDFNQRALPLNQKAAGEIRDLMSDLEAIPEPTIPTKRAEFQREAAIASELLRALQEGDLVTNSKCTLPYPLVRSSLTLKTSWQGVPVVCRLKPKFSTPRELMMQGAPLTALVPRTATRWQFGTTIVELEFKALLDHSSRAEPLQLPMDPPPTDGWPNVFRVVFHLIYEISWVLRQRDLFIGTWAPSPADLGDIEYWISTAKDSRINDIRKSNPALGLIGFHIEDVETENVIDLGEISTTSWHGRCRILAEQYLALGDTREAMFWLNVGVESLLTDRMQSILKESSSSINESDLTGAPSYWDMAKALVAENYPEVAAKIDWPKNVPHVSMFRRLKFFGKHFSLAQPAKDVSAHYSKIQSDRNALFHGENEKPIDPIRVKTAIESFDWLSKHFGPSKT